MEFSSPKIKNFFSEKRFFYISEKGTFKKKLLKFQEGTFRARELKKHSEKISYISGENSKVPKTKISYTYE